MGQKKNYNTLAIAAVILLLAVVAEPAGDLITLGFLAQKAVYLAGLWAAGFAFGEAERLARTTLYSARPRRTEYDTDADYEAAMDLYVIDLEEDRL